EPEILSLKGLGNEGTHGPTAAEILVRPGHETVDPTRDGEKPIQIAIRELPGLACVVEIVEKIEICRLCSHGTLLRSGVPDPGSRKDDGSDHRCKSNQTESFPHHHLLVVFVTNTGSDGLCGRVDGRTWKHRAERMDNALVTPRGSRRPATS